MRTIRAILLTTVTALLASAGLAQATPDATSRPERGLRMTVVEARYGTPTNRYPAVGKPPIARWDYPTMVVYFENDQVIHTVLVPTAD